MLAQNRSPLLVACLGIFFLVDVGFDHILLNPKTECTLDIDCEPASPEVMQDVYAGQDYHFRRSSTLIGWDKISPAVISDDQQFNALRVFQVRSLVDHDSDAKGTSPRVDQGTLQSLETSRSASIHIWL